MQTPILRAALLSALAALPGAALAQDARCARLDAQLRAIDLASDADPARVARYRDAVERQNQELQRTQDYAASIGCDSVLFEPAAQCAALDANIRRMDRNLRLLQTQVSRLSDDLGARREAERRRTLALLASLDCNGTPARQDAELDEPQASGTFEQLFGPDGAEPHAAGPDAAEPDASPETALPDPTLPLFGPLPHGNNLRTICVRTCDGYFFPISFATGPASFAGDAETCRRQCPGATVELYAYDNTSQKPEDAISTVSGGLLSAMPNAFKFRTSLDKACTCHREGEAAVQSQAPAGEALKRLDQETPPGAAAPVQAAPRKAAVNSLPTTEGREIEVTNPDGSKKRVRVIAPGLTPAQ